MTDAVEFHSRTAERFARQYATDPDFADRLAVWRSILDERVRPGGVVIDAGCGPGDLAFEAAARGATVVAIDGSPEMIALGEAEKARRGAPSVQFRTARLPSSDLALPPADLIIVSSVFEYVLDPVDLFSWASARLKPGGVVAASFPNRASLFRAWEWATYKMTGRPRYLRSVQNRPVPADADRWAEKAGLERIRVRYVGGRKAICRIASAMGASEARSHNLFVAEYQIRPGG